MSVTPRVLLAVFAHPDDESFGPGGTLARYAAEGVQVYLACATRGEVGGVDEALLEGYKDIAQLRTQELYCAARHLGLAGVNFLEYRDSGMEGSADNLHPESLVAAPLEEVTEKLVRLMRELRPQVVITFDPVGGYFHPDHIACHKATVAAFQRAGEGTAFAGQVEKGWAPYQPQKLYYSTIPRNLIKLVVRLMPLFGADPQRIGRNKDINLKRIAEVNLPVTTVIDVAPYLNQKEEASACHKSQGSGPGAFGMFPRFLRRRAMGKESFSRAVPQPVAEEAKERDLFAGVTPEPMF
ncbi:MAG: GlcNAc-PI de-N-acetylase [Chloroflexi bacterium]|nr:GlcNAc-PI de-N-acetylase [Chloroflexota bacterium]